MKGKRVFPDAEGHLVLAEGDYGLDQYGLWWVRPPGQGAGVLDGHSVLEHADNTITVSPSIIAGSWHGYLERGEWRSV